MITHAFYTEARKLRPSGDQSDTSLAKLLRAKLSSFSAFVARS